MATPSTAAWLEVADRVFVERQGAGLAAAIRRVVSGELDADDIVAAVAFPEPTAHEALHRALALFLAEEIGTPRSDRP